MVRAPCCEKEGLKKGPWTSEEDEILTSYIQKHGHSNWRALPKHAGLLRCGKSCRLRWINYLKPDIKRGNFTSEEEDIIIKMHELLGNRWSAIAAKLPGRTDNEIKNVWHTHLKKRLIKTNNNQPISNTKKRASKSKIKRTDSNSSTIIQSNEPSSNSPNNHFIEMETTSSNSNFSSDFSSQGKNIDNSINNFEDLEDSFVTMLEIDESFWSETLTTDDEISSTMPSNSSITIISNELPNQQYPIDNSVENFQKSFDDDDDDGMDFWYDLFIRSGESTELPEF